MYAECFGLWRVPPPGFPTAVLSLHVENQCSPPQLCFILILSDMGCLSCFLDTRICLMASTQACRSSSNLQPSHPPLTSTPAWAEVDRPLGRCRGVYCALCAWELTVLWSQSQPEIIKASKTLVISFIQHQCFRIYFYCITVSFYNWVSFSSRICSCHMKW